MSSCLVARGLISQLHRASFVQTYSQFSVDTTVCSLAYCVISQLWTKLPSTSMYWFCVAWILGMIVGLYNNNIPSFVSASACIQNQLHCSALPLAWLHGLLFMSASHCLEYYKFVTYQIRLYNVSSFILLAQDFLDCSGSSKFSAVFFYLE